MQPQAGTLETEEDPSSACVDDLPGTGENQSGQVSPPRKASINLEKAVS